MKCLALPLALSLAAGPALALSCLRVDVAMSYQDAAASDAYYVVVHGTLTFDQSKLPKVDLERQDQTPPLTEIPARLTGMSLSTDGFQNAYDRPITLRIECFGPWCGMAESGTEHLSFVEKTDDSHVLTITPCGGFDFAEPTEAMLRTVTQCFQGKACTN